jgi:hypothetical protein
MPAMSAAANLDAKRFGPVAHDTTDLPGIDPLREAEQDPILVRVRGAAAGAYLGVESRNRSGSRKVGPPRAHPISDHGFPSRRSNPTPL